ncbi:bifunctional methylenetetrahydrofolate dehydrogenase/methenyltetrahydrofolate cyclohydrolase [Periweissella cryptocerci]|uniref:Bifunctional protein FolD n=1 Tax=Periweissella cryptocerci TaxID=2506420 RepID=A0A4P6YVF6_9LACO|nr:tetrahydrofolate dehydrogenase/cyclohydrolase catalytic domain-containing protein [Periweissella cryptocerci]QBO36751.1 bifunctional methylenetetrahydrofolate dehydrogenase/methenyltetrahydrofolate cyclohydrolase [Periweissella cryptocerci]
MTVKIDGKAIATKVKAEVAVEVEKLMDLGVTPGLAVVLVGEDPASQIYVRNKQRAAEKLGIDSQTINMPADTTEATLLAKIAELNADPAIDAILVQSPVPAQINESRIQEAILPSKDVDGFHAYNIGALFANKHQYYPVANTPRGIMTLLAEYDIDVAGKQALVIGRSILVGRPMMAMLNNANATVTLAHRFTQNLDDLLATADIVVVAVGIPNFVQPDNLKKGAVVIDVGINRMDDGSLVGDVAEDVHEQTSYITPVPGGVGPMTIATLMQTTVELAKSHMKIENEG